MKIIIDRFEDNHAVVELEDKSTVDMPRVLLPKEAKEGDIIEISIDIEETKTRRERIEKLMNDLWED